jgi:hypothetical protein
MREGRGGGNPKPNSNDPILQCLQRNEAGNSALRSLCCLLFKKPVEQEATERTEAEIRSSKTEIRNQIPTIQCSNVQNGKRRATQPSVPSVASCSLLLKNRLAGGCEFPVDNFIEKFLVFGRVLITLADVKWRSSIPEDFSAAQDAHSPG